MRKRVVPSNNKVAVWARVPHFVATTLRLRAKRENRSLANIVETILAHQALKDRIHEHEP